MKRNLLITAVEREAGRLGYDFHTGHEVLLPAKVGAGPAIWLMPPKVIAEQGRRECRTTYRLNLYFITPLTPSNRGNIEPEICRLEADALELFHSLGDDAEVESTLNFKTSPCKAPLTKNGEIAIAAEMDVRQFYCR